VAACVGSTSRNAMVSSSIESQLQSTNMGATIVRRFAVAITPATRVISVSHVISSTGLRMPISEISALARELGILCVVDGAKAVGAIWVNVKALGCHAYATSGLEGRQGPCD
jgi:selenocysteine lyase/cysteine desulfurase